MSKYIKCLVLILIALTSFFFILYTTNFVFDRIPHSQDEVAYLFQATVFKSGHLFLDSYPKNIRRFFDHEFIVNNGHWYGKYSPGESFFLTVGLFLNFPWLINPIFGLLSIILLFVLIKDLFSYKTALLTIILFSLSPFFILISSSFLSHPSALFFTLLFFTSCCKINKIKEIKLHWAIIQGISIGMVFLIRPYNTIPLLIFLILFYLSKFVKLIEINDKINLVKIFFIACFTISIFIVIHLIYNKILTRDFFKFPHMEYSSFDFIGFGSRGVEWGLDFTPQQAGKNLLINFYALKELFITWPNFYLIIFFLINLFHKKRFISLALFLFFVLHIISYFFYFHPGTFLGPRYWFEASWVIIVLVSQGIVILFDSIKKRLNKLSFYFFYFFILLLMSYYLINKNLTILPTFKNYNGMHKVSVPVMKKPSLIFIPGKENWQAYGLFFILQDPPFYKNRVIFVRDNAIHNVPKDLPPLNNKLLENYFPNRQIYKLNQDLFIKE